MSNFIVEPTERIKRLPPYLFGQINALKLEKRRQDIDIIDLGMGNPMDGAPKIVIEKLCQAAQDPRNHRYSASKGIYNLRREMALKYERKWGVSLDPETEVLACIGSKEGFSHSVWPCWSRAIRRLWAIRRFRSISTAWCGRGNVIPSAGL